jgi:uncharacterized protein YcbK (DUF882 family)
MSNKSSNEHGLILPASFSSDLPRAHIEKAMASSEPEQMSRRGFLRFMRAAAGAATAASVAPLWAATQQADFWEQPRELWLYRYATKEQIRATYFKDGQLVPEEYNRLCWFMRDAHSNKMVAMDQVLLDVLNGIQGFYRLNGWNYPIVLNSGYRSPETNKKLENEGAAKNSMHLYGKAADIYMPGAPVKDVARLGVHFKQGGVGFYESKGFVHVDAGRLRSWRG